MMKRLALICAVAWIALLSGCMVTPPDIKKATELCSANKGLSGLRVDTYNKTIIIRCMNNAYFYVER